MKKNGAVSRVLIIKMGYSETLDAGISRFPSLGDVLRTTVILHAFANDRVTWLVDGDAYPLLRGNPLIERILVFNQDSAMQLQKERFDAIINLEKVPEICALADSIPAGRRYGFRFHAASGRAEAHDGCETVFSLCRSSDLKRASRRSWQEALYQVIGARWEGQEYVLGYRPRTVETYDVGLNWAVGSKWPNKAWPMDYWEELKNLFRGEFSYSAQQGLNDLAEYMDWIHSCRLLVTNDSLGLHIALAMRKMVVVMYGPTNPNEIYFYRRGEVIYPSVAYDCIPCLSPLCRQDRTCMEFIAPAAVRERVCRMLDASGDASRLEAAGQRPAGEGKG